MRVAVLFAGGGFSATGHVLAGDEVAFLAELDRNCRETLDLNFPGVPVAGDVREIHGDEVLQAAGSEVDVLDCSPPCQSFSTAGLQDLDSDNAMLLHEVPRIAGGMDPRPRVVLVENVPGLVRGRAKTRHFDHLVWGLRAQGYRIGARKIDSSWLGVGQRRVRVFVVGVREDLGLDPVAAFPNYESRRTVMGDALPGAAALVRIPRESWEPGQLCCRDERRWMASEPAPTMTTKGVAGGKDAAHLEEARIEEADSSLRELTVDDGRALAGVPPTFRFPAGMSRKACWKLLGNGVPPPVAMAFARSIRGALEGRSGERTPPSR